MICKNCGNDIPNNSMFCLLCGSPVEIVGAQMTSQESFDNKTDNSSNDGINNKSSSDKRINKKVLRLIIITILVFSVIALGTYACLHFFKNSVDKYLSLIENGKTSEASEYYASKVDNNTELIDEIKTKATARLDKIYADYIDNSISFDDAIKRVVVYKDSPIVTINASDIEKRIEAVNTSRIAFSAAKSAQATGDIKTAISNYNLVIKDDPDYNEAINNIATLKADYKKKIITESSNLAANKKYSDAILSLSEAIDTIGEDEELTALISSYKSAKNNEFVTVRLTSKGKLPMNYDAWRFSDYVTFVFSITNNSEKDIKGVEGTALFNDIFGKEIITIGCDFTGHTIKSGETITISDLSLEVNQFIDSNTKLYNTDYSDLQFEYEVKSVVFTDGTTIKPE